MGSPILNRLAEYNNNGYLMSLCRNVHGHKFTFFQTSKVYLWWESLRPCCLGGGGCNPKICGSVGFFRYFSVFFGIFRFFCGTFLVFFDLNSDKKFQPFKNHVNNEILGGQELPNSTLNA